MLRNINFLKWFVLGFVLIVFTACESSSNALEEPTTENIVIKQNMPPTASDFNITLSANESTVSVDWKVSANANDADNDTLTAQVKQQGKYGTCTVTDTTLTYLKTIETNATDSCMLEISDGEESVDFNVSIRQNIPPTAADLNMTLDVNKSTVSVDWKVSANANDADNDTLTAQVKQQGKYGTCVVTDTTLTYLKTIETNATDSCSLEISDGWDSVDINVSIKTLYWKEISAGRNHTVAL